MFPSLLPPSPFKTPNHLCSDGKEVPWFPPRSAVTESGLCSLPELKSSCVYLCHPPGSTTEASLSSIRISPLLGSGHHRLSPGLLPPTEAPAPRLTFLQPTFLLSTHNRFGHQALPSYAKPSEMVCPCSPDARSSRKWSAVRRPN